MPLRALLLCLVLPVAAAVAQSSGIQTAPTEKPTPSNAPRKLPDALPTPPPPATTAATPRPAPGPPRSPDEIANAFFESLKADKVEAAYDTLDREFAMVDRGDQSRSIREQTQRALDAYGPVTGYELIREEPLGTALVRRTYILTGEQLPLRWRFYFYKPADRWTLIDLRIDDAIVEWFDHARPKAP